MERMWYFGLSIYKESPLGERKEKERNINSIIKIHKVVVGKVMLTAQRTLNTAIASSYRDLVR